MKFAFSTLGMPGTGLAEAVATATRHGCAGLELRLHPDTGVHAGLTATGRAAVRSTVAGTGGLVIAVLAHAPGAAVDGWGTA
ncbi:hypothetical protein [Streptosporangium roseum]|uniref:hypothetical protein n=1 Tax=Streptosporangium roseum TaxID=2001 RepID=UPI0004CD7899|nr:hypothetical protein [Streptosporangium roseum]